MLESEERLLALMDHAPSPFFMKDKEGRYVYLNKAYEDQFVHSKDWHGKTDFDFWSKESAELFRGNDLETLASGRPQEFLEETTGPDGNRCCHLCYKFPFIATRGDTFLGGITINVLDRVLAQEALAESNQEKEVLLKEIHHRVKNNMQIISSLLDLQTNAVQDPRLEASFRDMRDRVRSMAMVHEKLYQSTSLARIDFAEYAEGLLISIWKSYQSTCKLSLQLNPVCLPINMAIPLGLILNELATNALKHAFNGNASAEFTVSLQADAESISLTCRDNGIGLPKGFDLTSASTLGLRLVSMLVEQINGTVQLNQTHGTEFKFKLNHVENGCA